jgi:putative transposase
MSRSSRTAPSKNGRAISGFLGIVSGMRCGRWSSPGKKTPGYKERDPGKRKAYLRLRERYGRRGKVVVYVDESGFAPAVTRRYAYAPRGQRVPGLIAGHRRPRTSLLAARVGNTFAAPVLFEGTCNTSLFNAWLEQQLCPLLHAQQVVVMDNVPFHKSAKTKALLHATGATLLFLPPYSPDFNPIEHDFATLKRLREYNEHASLDSIVKTYKYQGA